MTKKVSNDNTTWQDSITIHGNDTAYWKIVVTNDGDCMLYNVTINDSGNSINIASLAIGESHTIYYNNSYADDFTNVVNVTAYDSLGMAVHASDSASIHVIHAALTIQKFGNTTEAHSGSIVNYTIYVNNTGSSMLYNVWANDSSLGINRYIGNLSAHSSYRFYIEHTLSSTPDPFINEIEATGYDILGMKYSSNDSFTIDILNPGINVTKTATPSVIYSGENVTWNITVTNTGDTILYNITVNDSTGYITTISSLLPAQKWHYSYKTNPLSNTTNVVTVNATDVLGGTVGDKDSASVIIAGRPHLVINKSDSPDPIVFGNTLTYFITIKNDGDAAAHDVVVVEHYDDDFIFNSATPSPDNGNNIWNIGTIEAGESFNITIYGHISDNWVTKLLNNVSFNSSDGGKGYDEEETSVIYPNANIEKFASSAVVEAGGVINFTIIYYNYGEINLTNMRILDSYPLHTTFISADPMPSIGNDTWIIGNLSVGEQGRINVTLAVDTPIENGSLLVNYVYLYGDGIRKEANASITVISHPELHVYKMDYPDPVESGDILNYTIVVENNGSGNATNVVVTDVFNQSMLSIVDSDNGTINGNSIIWNIPHLAAGESKIIKIKATTAIVDVNTTILNYVNATCSEGSYAEDNETTTILAPPYMGFPFLEIEKNDRVDPLYSLDNEEYEIVVRNIGDGMATNVTIVDLMDEGMEFVNATPMPVLNGSKLMWNIGNLDAGESMTIKLFIKMTEYGVRLNYVNATCSEGSYAEDNETTEVINDSEPPHSWKVFHGKVENVSIGGLYILHYIPKTTFITLASVDNISGVAHIYYRIWKLDNNSKWHLIFDWKEYFGEEIHLYEMEGYGKYEIEFYSVDKAGNVEKVEWNDVYVYKEEEEIKTTSSNAPLLLLRTQK